MQILFQKKLSVKKPNKIKFAHFVEKGGQSTKDITITKTRLFKYIGNFTTKNWKFSDKNSYIFHISTQIIDFGYLLEQPQWGGSNKYPQSMFLRRNKKKNVYPFKPKFYYIKVGFRGSKLYRHVFVMTARLCRFIWVFVLSYCIKAHTNHRNTIKKKST